MWSSHCTSTTQLPQTRRETGMLSIFAQKAALGKFKFDCFQSSSLCLGWRGNYQYCWSCRNSIISFSHLDYCFLLLPFKSLQKERCSKTTRGCEFLTTEQKAEIAMYSSLFSWHYLNLWGTLLPSTLSLILEDFSEILVWVERRELREQGEEMSEGSEVPGRTDPCLCIHLWHPEPQISESEEFQGLWAGE